MLDAGGDDDQPAALQRGAGQCEKQAETTVKILAMQSDAVRLGAERPVR